MFKIDFRTKWQKEYESIKEEYEKKVKFRYDMERYLTDKWIEGVFSHKYLSGYDRYILEFIFKTNNPYSDDGLYHNLIIYNQDLEVVYDFKNRLYDLPEDSEYVYNQRMWELKYWLSLDWEELNE